MTTADDTTDAIKHNTRLLARADVPADSASLPCVAALREIMQLVRAVLFPGYFGECRAADPELRACFIGVALERLTGLLVGQIARSLGCPDADARPRALRFINMLPELRRLLLTDVEAIYRNDPAVTSRGEVIFCYPGVLAMTHYRTAHALLSMEIPVIPRIITELAHSATGIDIHPGARIGEFFAIDHGTGIVIGQTCIIGNNVTIYQGVTLGSKNFSFDSDGHPENRPRHPIIEDCVTIYSNASVLGRITVGHHAVIGGNIWVTENVPPHARITQFKPKP